MIIKREAVGCRLAIKMSDSTGGRDFPILEIPQNSILAFFLLFLPTSKKGLFETLFSYRNFQRKKQACEAPSYASTKL